MEKINRNDALFLFALNASEESSISETRSDFDKWDAAEFNVLLVLQSLVQDGVILFGIRGVDKITDYTLAESLEFVTRFDFVNSHDVIIFLTDKGFERWDNDTWGITTDRAKHLMFSGKGNPTRVQ